MVGTVRYFSRDSVISDAIFGGTNSIFLHFCTSVISFFFTLARAKTRFFQHDNGHYKFLRKFGNRRFFATSFKEFLIRFQIVYVYTVLVPTSKSGQIYRLICGCKITSTQFVRDIFYVEIKMYQSRRFLNRVPFSYEFIFDLHLRRMRLRLELWTL